MQVQSNALAALEAIDEDLAESILEEGCVTGDRVNGLCDGVTGDWCVQPLASICYCQFLRHKINSKAKVAIIFSTHLDMYTACQEL